uniref:DUF6824 domain-containing protein n=1 Tax=Craspedostauros australis TaxID=1486917 RepID=A0A7R9ZTD5_9STRA|mmetsp:Transcript_9770/g.26629  ORF Transcript_9770/g.26629 Transcript_9770/m.26629 type:complete len:434 (+) Transcript_9770:691-1992(+)|eukprot:CAMPEP_0198115578 /NCGR_PEP_ID=MMETSP1442-20131203/6632_1 /TAXON_ID= /ORGANISM="Craspedostauros australis, Strain CCMP3328" /LENGTH=433 /DNA_ID=CAMNT_0043773115 /DNA_START=677 /DNA_END=1978 /DNA_ORIENTATION=+
MEPAEVATWISCRNNCHTDCDDEDAMIFGQTKASDPPAFGGRGFHIVHEHGENDNTAFPHVQGDAFETGIYRSDTNSIHHNSADDAFEPTASVVQVPSSQGGPKEQFEEVHADALNCLPPSPPSFIPQSPKAASVRVAPTAVAPANVIRTCSLDSKDPVPGDALTQTASFDVTFPGAIASSPQVGTVPNSTACATQHPGYFATQSHVNNDNSKKRNRTISFCEGSPELGGLSDPSSAPLNFPEFTTAIFPEVPDVVMVNFGSSEDQGAQQTASPRTQAMQEQRDAGTKADAVDSHSGDCSGDRSGDRSDDAAPDMLQHQMDRLVSLIGSPTTWMLKTQITKSDIIPGPGGKSNNWDGNKKYMCFVKDMYTDYWKHAETRPEHKTIVKQVKDEIKSRGGRFLKETIIYTEMNDDEITKKIQSSLRQLKRKRESP